MVELDKREIFYEIFDSSLPRLGPGDDESTRKALGVVQLSREERPEGIIGPDSKILDLGCGNGAQTMQLALNTQGRVLAVDNHRPYLDELLRRAKTAGVEGRIEVRLEDMRHLEFEEGSARLVWSEGAMFVMGFREGLGKCYELVEKGGCVAATELCWLRDDAPSECRDFFGEEYPAMADTEANLAVIRDVGYSLLDSFTLPESSWWDDYYGPLERRLAGLEEEYSSDAEKLEVIDWIRTEIEMYRRYSDYYGYVFFVMKR